MIKVVKAFIVIIHSKLQIFNYMHLIRRNTAIYVVAYSKQELNKYFHGELRILEREEIMIKVVIFKVIRS